MTGHKGEREKDSQSQSAPGAAEGGPDYLIVGEIAGAFGVKGEVKANIVTEFPERFKSLKTIYVGEAHQARAIQGVKFSRGQVILKLEGSDDPAVARDLQGALLFVPISEAVPLPEDQYYHYQLIGLEVWTVSGEFVGRVIDVMTRAANDVFVVQRDKGEALIPAVKQVVRRLDVEAGRMEIEPLPGLLAPEEDDQP